MSKYVDQNGFKMSQSITNPAILNIKQVQSIVPSQSTPSFGSTFNIIVNNVGIEINKINLIFTASAVTGLSGSDANHPLVAPAAFWVKTINIYVGTQIFEVTCADAEWLLTQLVSRDDKRIFDNYNQGSYLTPSVRRTMALTNNQHYAVDISHVFRQLRYVIGNTNLSLRFEITMNSLANIITQGSTLTGTPVMTLNSAQLQIYSTNLSPGHVQYINQQIASPQNYKLRYHETRPFTATIASGTSGSVQITLTGLVGNVAYLAFFGRLDGATTGENYTSFAPVSAFDILDGSSTSIIGGTPIEAQQNFANLGKVWSRSTFLLESLTGANASNVYIWSFSMDPMEALTTGRRLGAQYFSGQTSVRHCTIS